ncbi:hypothetical protein F511_06465 [Dorcoceras hygrometricum]|uniref:Uncharacterized protein n=1 Tax=Dorcoceras hygrometricum TaxID=472368 RepID=A0A2Z7D9X5_9LAMI|nr:hypothetical protein F511_06465 [Dorcoceras hygrometricum]
MIRWFIFFSSSSFSFDAFVPPPSSLPPTSSSPTVIVGSFYDHFSKEIPCINRSRAKNFKLPLLPESGFRIRRCANSGIIALARLCQYTILPELHQKSRFPNKKILDAAARPPCSFRPPCTPAARTLRQSTRGPAHASCTQVAVGVARLSLTPHAHIPAGVAPAGRYLCVHVAHEGARTSRTRVRRLLSHPVHAGRMAGCPPCAHVSPMRWCRGRDAAVEFES